MRARGAFLTVGQHSRISVNGDICICIVGSLCYKAETNTPL